MGIKRNKGEGKGKERGSTRRRRRREGEGGRGKGVVINQRGAGGKKATEGERGIRKI